MDIRLRRNYWIIILIIVSISSTLYFFGDEMIIPYTTDSGYVTKMTRFNIENNVDLFSENMIHEIDVDMDWDDYESLLKTYEETGEKDYFKTDITIDGVTVEDVGIRLKGQLTLQTTFQGSNQMDSMQLPFLVKFDEYVDGQCYQGITELCIRIGSSYALLEEPLALYTHSISGAVVPEWAYASVKISELDPAYYVICENIDESYLINYFDDYEGVLYKAGNSVTFAYKGEDQTEYMEDFEQKTKKNEEDFAPFIAFLKFIDESSDDEFEEQLGDWVDIDALITMMAVNDLVENSDSFSGMNSNYYLYYDQRTEKFLILAWDMNLAFGAMMGQGDMQRGGAFGNMDDRGNNTGIPPGDMQEMNMENMINFTPTEGMNMNASMMQQDNKSKFTPPDGDFGNLTRPERMSEIGDMPDMGDMAGGNFPGEMQGYGNLGEGVERGEMNSQNSAENALKDRFFANENFSALYKERYEEIANGIYCNDLLLEKLDLIAETFTEYNSEYSIMDQETYDSEVEDMRNYIEEKQAENCDD
ncbi:spore coat assembly protein [Methanolobus tindarius DSM 2278]|jgi:spore coat protein CotH|uniref:Spore coat assembly protein n=1 Tax=Methanolobus tindarius DSM 2278 TaxID=1090322 RepID=W9DXQ5_METTI|nr:CotH kinase family protein [Methanolobus tindarius]ETA68196.1 spore coat assembly protein [Methanolobus tindarius DSM 2278]